MSSGRGRARTRVSYRERTTGEMVGDVTTAGYRDEDGSNGNR